VPHPLRLSKGAVFDFEAFSSGLRAIPAARPDLSFREDVTKLQKGDFFASKLIVFSVTFGRKTKKSQPPSGASRRFFPDFAPAKLSACAVEKSLFDLSRKPRWFSFDHSNPSRHPRKKTKITLPHNYRNAIILIR
jgi:hypothetical protein